jgi:pimeloyl-ACP methyl ester carboxylesterase
VVERVPAVRGHVFAGVGHFANLEVPAAFNAQVERFLEEADPGLRG